ncbi:GNAT family N-acetyltransferase [Roseomonas sp. KE2513]|uniref:lipid II:glycine glycyltransferase FemX n=1 Tax=Roseomonas sp. KE2513 TaxID=2479202 RepID=UPI0018DF665A|nr:GNAT family N-acetyltransferase [Roseomonas sp. KE2513]
MLRRLPVLGHVGYVAYGPLVAVNAPERADVARDLARDLAQLEDVRMLFVQPPEGGQDFRDHLLNHGFRHSTTQVALRGSIRIDLTRDIHEIRQRLSPRLRSWSSRWPSVGVAVRLGDERDLPLLVDLMRATAAAQGYHSPPRLEYLQHLYTTLALSGQAALFVGEVHGRPVTADLVTMCGGMVRGRYAGFDRTGPGARLSVPGAARWEMIRWAKQSGYRWLDFGGLADETLRDTIDLGRRSCASWPGPDKAKLSFGGEPYRYPAPVELIRPAALRLALNAVTKSELGRHGMEQVRIWMRARRERDWPQRWIRKPRAGSTTPP